MFRPLHIERGAGRVRCRIGFSRLAFLALLSLALDATATTASLNPYSGIVERNSFGLKPPVNPADLVKPPPPQTADIKLQGITTILGRKQVLMKLKLPARPPEPAREQSFVFVEGQREGEVEVKEINPAEGSVKVDNGGTILSLNMKDNGEKPTPGAAPPPPSGGLPGVPPPPPAVSVLPASAANPAAPSGGTSVTTFGGAGQSVSSFSAGTGSTAGFGNTAQKTIPSRALRTSAATGAATSSIGGELQNLSPEAQAILIESQRGQIAPGGYDPLPKTAITPRHQQP